ncbi:hypothetical protein D9757_000331 [Collybiopsis confluens]|uniref:Kinesin-like protein n=1 Tax=Collybiopsis confluens TaxID=2823264 RepID=A0A8H5I2G3_9AGAR|nr:hypothetical protein D9757_000331 [Collybiopsis confluens]
MSTQPVQIIARIRPALQDEQTDDAISIVPIPSEHALTAARPIPFTSWVSLSSTTSKSGAAQIQQSQTAFHTAFDASASQQELFDRAVSPHLPPLLKGHTLTILAYGPTSSGKTHTMEGSSAEPGIIPRALRVLFEMSKEGKQNGDITSFEFHMSYLELYRDDAFDLLVSQKTHEKLPIRTNARGETFVIGLTRAPVESFEHWTKIFRTASQNRTTGATLLNRASSRSHAILSIEVEVVTAPTADTREITYVGKINLVDLAGSENNKHTGNSLANPARLAESAAINKSLSTLGQVVHALNTGASRIPYRDSNLTRLLSASLGGKAHGKTILLCNLAPGVKFRSDVLNTLNFASRTKNIETRTVVNEREKPAPIEKEYPHPHRPPQAAHLARRASLQSRRTSTSLIPGPGQRVSSYGSAVGSSRLSGFGFGMGSMSMKGMGTGGGGIDDTELDERINRAVEAKVEAEVQRRLQERDEALEKERQLKQMQEEQAQEERESSVSAATGMQIDNGGVFVEDDEDLIGADEEEQQEEEQQEEEQQPMDIDQGDLKVDVGTGAVPMSSPMKVDSMQSSEIVVDGGQDAKARMEELERKYKEHIAQLEAQLASAASSSDPCPPPPGVDGSTSLSSSSSSLSSSIGDSNSLVHTPLTLDTGLVGTVSEVSSIEAMSVAERKKAGRAYVSLARGYTEKNDLATALALYRHAAMFVPDNAKLKERIIDVEWAVKNGKSYLPTPKRQHHREEKPKRKSKSHPHHASRSRSSRSLSASHVPLESKENGENDPSASAAQIQQQSLKGSKRKRSVSREPTPADDETDYVFIPTSSTAGFGTDLGNIDEEAEVEVEGGGEVEADEFGTKILRRSPKKRMSLRSPSVTDKRKMLGMSLAATELFNHGPLETFASHGASLVAAVGGMSTPGGSASVRKTRRVSDLAGYSGRNMEVNGDLEGAPSKQKRARLV